MRVSVALLKKKGFNTISKKGTRFNSILMKYLIIVRKNIKD